MLQVEPVNLADLSRLLGEVEEVKDDPMLRVDGGIHAQFPCAKKPPALLGVWHHPGDQWHGRRVFVKGPELRNNALTALWCAKLKPLLGLRTIETRVLRFGAAYYILQPGLETGVPTQIKRVKNGKEITIRMPDKDVRASKHFQDYLEHQVDWSDIPQSVKADYVTVLLFRQVLGLTDTCNRNVFIRLGHEVYSIDETHTGRVLRPEFVRVTKRFEAELRRWFLAERAQYKAVLANWRRFFVDPKNAGWLLPGIDLASRINAVERAADSF